MGYRSDFFDEKKTDKELSTADKQGDITFRRFIRKVGATKLARLKIILDSRDMLLIPSFALISASFQFHC